ncbi:MAG: ROK family protein [Roseateles sp.]|uniref:ROK family protein n=1 Tax=Roseateles sp. TaxID=1971397 RepID=UPI0039ED0D3B
MSPLFFGLDIGGTKIELAACDATLAVLHRERIATPGADFDAFVAQTAALVRRAEAALGRPAQAVGLGMPGVADAATGCQLSSNVPALNGRRVAPALAAALGRTVHLGNDCQCFALSEAQGGAADGLPSMFGAILGTGAGGGFCVGGRLLAGYSGLAGEWGHGPASAALLAAHGLPVLDCPCGLRGCLERYVSGSGLAAIHRLRGGDARDAEAVHALAAQGDAAARAALAIHLDLLAQGLAGLVLVLDPHAIVLGGGLSKLQRLYDELPGAIARHLFRGARVPPVLPPRFGDAGGARGAALLARQRFTPSAP